MLPVAQAVVDVEIICARENLVNFTQEVLVWISVRCAGKLLSEGLAILKEGEDWIPNGH